MGSPDGTQVAFATIGLDGMPTLRVVTVRDPSEQRLISDGIVTGWPDWSPDGKRLAWTELTEDGSTDELVTFDLATGTRKEWLWPPCYVLFQKWAPSGKSLALLLYPPGQWEDRGVYLLDPQTGALTAIAKPGSQRFFWYGDGKLAYLSAKLTSDGNNITFWSAASGQLPEQLMATSLPKEIVWSDMRPPWFAAKEELLLAAGPKGAASHIYLLDVPHESTSQLTSGPGSDTFPCWSPDGTRIAFVRNKTELWTMASDGSNQQKLLSVDELPL